MSQARLLLCGRAGSGKTARVLAALRRIARSGQEAGRFARFQVLVPTYSRAEHLKRRLIRGADGAPGIFDRGVGTFEQYAERETGLRLSELAPPATRDQLLAAALDDVDAPVFREVRGFAGLRRSALRFVKEVKASEPEPGPGAVAAACERLRTVAATLAGERGRKLDALARVLGAYQERLEQAGLLDHEDLLRRLLLRLRERPPTDLELFAVDGFSDLTEVQERIVQLVAGHAQESIIGLLCGTREDEGGPFHGAWDLRKRLTVGSGFAVETLDGNQRASGDLARLEQLLAGEPVEPVPADGSVRFLAGADPDDEADRVARTCLRWSSEGVPRSEMLVVLRSLQGPDVARLLGALRRHEVPARLMGRLPALGVPQVRHAVRILRIVAGLDGPSEALEAVRAGNAREVLSGEADRLGEQARLHRSAGATALRELAQDQGLGTCAAWLERVEQAAHAPDDLRPPAALAHTLLAAVDDLLVLPFGKGLEGAAAERAAMAAAGLKRLRTLVADLVAAYGATGRERVAARDIVAHLEQALTGAWVTVRDRRVDVVNVVDAEEARQWEARAVVVCGLRMGAFPTLAREDVFVSDHDRRDVAGRTGVRLASRVDAAQRRERELFYAAATRAREHLVLTAPVADATGDPVILSPFMEQALTLLPEGDRRLGGAGRTPGDVRPAPGETFHHGDLLRTSLASLTARHDAEGPTAVAAHAGLHVLERLAQRDGEVPAVARRAARWFASSGARLREGGAASAKMAAPRSRSSSSLSDFAQCAFKHFARKGLGLKEPKAGYEGGLDPLRAGTIVHGALERAFKQGASTPDAVRAAFREAFAEEVPALRPSLAVVRERSRMERAVLDFVLADAPVRGFAPREHEWAFGMDGAEPLRLGPGGEVTVAGKIDRIDLDPGGRAVVIDYKWSRKTRYGGLKAKLETAQELQLPLYAMAVEQLLGGSVVGALFLPLKESLPLPIGVRFDGVAASRSVHDWSGRKEELLASTRDRVLELDRQIRTGGIAVDPDDEDRCGPSRCAIADLCRHEGYALE